MPCNSQEILLKNVKLTKVSNSPVEDGQKLLKEKALYFDTWQPIGKSYNGKILVSTRKLTSTFGKLSGLASQLSNCIGDKKCKSSWLILTPEKYSCTL